ncbi:hypothetical protein D3C84_903190 [compost metagenome]
MSLGPGRRSVLDSAKFEHAFTQIRDVLRDDQRIAPQQHPGRHAGVAGGVVDVRLDIAELRGCQVRGFVHGRSSNAGFILLPGEIFELLQVLSGGLRHGMQGRLLVEGGSNTHLVEYFQHLAQLRTYFLRGLRSAL